MKLHEIKIGKTEKVLALLKKKEEKKTGNGKPYVVFTLTDGISEITAKLWDRTCHEVLIPEGVVLEAELEAQEYGGAKCFVVKSYEASGEDPANYTKAAPYEAGAMFSAVRNAAAVLPPELKLITEQLLSENQAALLLWPGSAASHHAYPGGLLLHICQLLALVKSVSAVYKADEPDMGLLYAAAILHDIGKLRAYRLVGAGSLEISTEGRLFRPEELSLLMVQETIREKKLAVNERLMLLMHLISSARCGMEALPEGIPATKEALIFALCNELDNRMDNYRTVLDVTAPGSLSDFSKLIGARLYRKEEAKEPNEK